MARPLLVAAAWLLGASPLLAQTFQIPWWTVDGGGAMGLAGGPFVLSGTAGQPDAGPALTGGSFALSGGFWTVALPSGGPQADLSLVKADSPDPVTGLQTLTYTLSVANAGPAAATSVTVADTLPAGAVFQSAGGPGWSCGEAGGVVTCTRATLAVGSAPSLSIVVTAPPLAGTITNTAAVSATETDPLPANNADSEPTTVNAATTADLAVTKTAGSARARWGMPLTYTITALNYGPNAVAGARLTDVFPPSLTLVTWTCSATAGSSCPAGGSGDIDRAVDLLAGGRAIFTAIGTVAAGAPDPLVNSAAISAPAGLHDPDSANNSASASTPAGPIGYYAVPPCRGADTRHPPGPSGGPALAANTTRNFPVTGLCLVPADAVAVAIIVTVAGETSPGNLRLHPAGLPPPSSSTINFAVNRPRANNAVIPLGTGGQMSVTCDMPGPGSTHFLFDVLGYFR